MRIAVCFSGQFRTGYDNLTGLRAYLGTEHHFDYFIHTWTRNSPHPDFPDRGMTDIDERVYRAFLHEMRINYSEIEDYVTTAKKYDGLVFQPLYYSADKSFGLTHKTPFNYDVVIKIRTDVIFPKGHTLQSHLVQFRGASNKLHFGINDFKEVSIDGSYGRVDDVHWLASPRTMRIACSYWKTLREDGEYPHNRFRPDDPDFEECWDQQIGFFEHLRSHGIGVQNFPLDPAETYQIMRVPPPPPLPPGWL